MKVFKWILATVLILIILLGIVVVLFINHFSMSSKPQVYTVDVAEEIKALDDPFHIILKIKGYHANYLQKESDMFSTWGYVVLNKNNGVTQSKDILLNKLIELAENDHWQLAKDIDKFTEVDFLNYGISKNDPDLEIIQTDNVNKDQLPATQYRGDFWLSDDMQTMVFSFRVDSE